MDDPQLPLFDWPVSIMGEGYRCLAAFEFDEAEQHFSAVFHSGQGEEEEISSALRACKYWQTMVQQNKKDPNTCSIEELYEEFRSYEFGNISGLYQLKDALLEYIAGQVLTSNSFYINGRDGENVSDLLMELSQFKKAEKVVLHRIENQPDDVQLRYSLAQIQWLNKQKGESVKNYALGLLHNPCEVPLHRILYKQLKTLIRDIGAEMAPAFGWVRGILPLVSIQENPTICSESHRRAVDCYRLLCSADRALRKKDYESCYRYRKKLKAEAPALFDEYFALLSKE